MSIIRRALVPAMILQCLLLAGCGGSGDDAQLRLLNVSVDYSSLDLYAGSDESDASEQLSAVTAGSLSSYVDLSPASYDLYLTSHGVSKSNALASASESFSKGTHKTWVAYGKTGGFDYLEIDEDQSDPSSGYADVQIVNTATDAGSVDVYLTSAGVSLNDVSPNFSSAVVGKATGFTSIADGTYELRVTGASSKSDLRLDATGITLTDKETVSVIITETAGGYLVNALVLPQKGSLTTENNPNSRVRAAIGLSSGSNVAASFGSTTLLSGAPAEAVGTYQLVTAGSESVTLTVNGSQVSVPSQTLTAGQDYTFLVWTDTSGATEEALATDSNRLPTSGYSSVRLVNLMSGLSDPIALSVDYVPIATKVSLGTASDYEQPTSSTTAALTVSDATTSAQIYSQTSTTLSSQGVFSLFMFGSASSPTGVLREDR